MEWRQKARPGSENSRHDLGSLAVIPHEMWLGLAVFEILCAILILSPAYRPKFSKMVPWGALGIAIEMVLFCSIDAMSGDPKYSSIIYRFLRSLSGRARLPANQKLWVIIFLTIYRVLFFPVVASSLF